MQSNQAKTIRVSPDTIDKLGKERIGFETPDECINRLLSKNPCDNQDDDVATPEEEE